MNKVTLCENTFEPSTWVTYEDVGDVRDFLVDHFGIWPDTAKVYLDYVADSADITPHDDAGIERLGKATGHFFVVVYPADPITILVIVALVVAAIAITLSIIFRPSANTKNTQQQSSNNQLANRQNTARPNERIPDIYGQLWATPDLIAVPYKIFVNSGQEVEHCYMCLGRGVYEIDEIREDVTDCDTIDGYSVQVYEPFTSPNSGDPPIIQIGPAINEKIVNLQVFGAVNGQSVQPPNAVFKGNGNDIRFVYPNEIQNDGSDDFTNYFDDPTTVGHDVYIRIGGLQSNDDTASDPAGVIHSTHLHGIYKVVSVGPLVIVLNNPSAVNSNWNIINTFSGHVSRYNLNPADSSGDNLCSVGAGGGDNLNNWTDKLKLIYPTMTEVWNNFVCPQGCFKVDKNGNQLAPIITISVRVQSCDVNGNPIGAAIINHCVLTGSVNDRMARGVTSKVVLPPGFASNGGILLDVRRASDEDHTTGMQVTDAVQWRDCYVVSAIDPITDFGDVTTVQTMVYPTPEALQIKERKLNMLVTRAVSIFAGVVPGTGLVEMVFAIDSEANPTTAVSTPQQCIIGSDNFTAWVISQNGDAVARIDLKTNTVVAIGRFDPSSLPAPAGAAWIAAGGAQHGGNGNECDHATSAIIAVDEDNNLWAYANVNGQGDWLACYDGNSFVAVKGKAAVEVVNTVTISEPLGVTSYVPGHCIISFFNYDNDKTHLLVVRDTRTGNVIGRAPLIVTGGIFSGGLSTGFPSDVLAHLLYDQRNAIVDDAGHVYFLTYGQHFSAGPTGYTTYDWYIHKIDLTGGTTIVGVWSPAYMSNDVSKYTGDASLGVGKAMIWDRVTNKLFVFTDTGVIHKIDPATMAIVDTLGTALAPAYKYTAGGEFNKLAGAGTDGGSIMCQNGVAKGTLYLPDPTIGAPNYRFLGLSTLDWSVVGTFDINTRVNGSSFTVSNCYAFDDVQKSLLLATPFPINLLGDNTSFMKVDRLYWNPAGTPVFLPEGATKNAADIIIAMALDPLIGGRISAELDVVGIHALLDPGGIIETYFRVNGYPSACCEFCYTFDDSKVSFEESLADVATAVFCTAYRRGSVITLSFEEETANSTLLFNHRNKLPKSETRTVSFGSMNDQDGINLDYIEPNAPNYPKLDTTVTLYFPPDQSAKNPKKITSIGIRNVYQATILGWRLYEKLILQNTTVQFDATQEAALAVLNDRILVADNTRADVQDGEVIAQASLLLTLSQNVVFEIGQTYMIFLQHPDQTVEAIAITAGPDPNQVILGAAPSIPCVVDAQMFARTGYMVVGSAPTRKNAMLMIEKTPKAGMIYEVKAINYDDAYYQHDTDFVSSGGFGTLFGEFGE